MPLIELSRGHFATVDDGDFDVVAPFSWSVRPASHGLPTFYAKRTDHSGERDRIVYMHRVNGELICDYVADFAYVRLGAPIVEDVKSKATRTRDYLIKKKLMRAVHHIEVREVA